MRRILLTTFVIAALAAAGRPVDAQVHHEGLLPGVLAQAQQPRDRAREKGDQDREEQTERTTRTLRIGANGELDLGERLGRHRRDAWPWPGGDAGDRQDRPGAVPGGCPGAARPGAGRRRGAWQPRRGARAVSERERDAEPRPQRQHLHRVQRHGAGRRPGNRALRLRKREHARRAWRAVARVGERQRDHCQRRACRRGEGDLRQRRDHRGRRTTATSTPPASAATSPCARARRGG